MEAEEFEQIPWANLVAEQEDGIDRRIYLAAGVVGLLVIAVFGMRLLGGGSQPAPPPVSGLEQPPTSIAVIEPVAPPPTSMVIAEADLRAEEPLVVETPNRLTEVTAEWFVTDWFTRDGSEETVRSIRAAISPTVDLDVLPHETEGEPVTFVEWARTIDTAATTDGVDVTVSYRAIRETENGFVRDPVATVILSLVRNGDRVMVTSLPTTDD